MGAIAKVRALERQFPGSLEASLAPRGQGRVHRCPGAGQGVAGDAGSILAAPFDPDDPPSTILRYVLCLKQPLVLQDVAVVGVFTRDPVVRRAGMRWVLCLSIAHQGKVLGLLHLENRTTAGAFGPDLVETVQVLAGQAAISLENTRLLVSLQRLTGDLEERVTERTRQLADEITARDKVEAALQPAQKMEAMGSLTGGVAHDFNNLLTPIVGSLDLVTRKNVGGRARAAPDAGAMQSAERAKTLVQRLLAFARRQPLHPTAVDVATLVRGMADLISSTSGPQIRVLVDVGAGLLGDLGYMVVEAASGEEVMHLIDGGLRLDMLVTDHLMRWMSGTHLAQAVRSHHPEVPVLIVSGYAESEGVASDLPRLTKPFRSDELAARLVTLTGAGAL